jgi:hypothetical protein
MRIVRVFLVATITVLSNDGTAHRKMEDVGQAHKSYETLQRYPIYLKTPLLFCRRPRLLYFTKFSTYFSAPNTPRSPTKPIMSPATLKKHGSTRTYVPFFFHTPPDRFFIYGDSLCQPLKPLDAFTDFNHGYH